MRSGMSGGVNGETRGSRWGDDVADVGFVLIILAFFALAVAYARIAPRL